MSDDKMPMDDENLNAPPVEESQEQKDQRVRDEQGRFAPKTPDAEGPKGKPDETVALRRYAQERDAARKEADDAKAARDALQKRFDDMSAIAKGEDPEAAKTPPDPLKPVIDRLDKIDQRQQTADERAQAEVVHKQVLQFAEEEGNKFRQQQPDLPNAIEHYSMSRINEMLAFGLSQEDAEAALEKEAQALLYQCAQANRSPAATLYAMAKARGYDGTNVVPFQQQQPAPQQQRPTGGRSFGNGGGAAPGAMTAAQIAAMSDDDYMAFRSTPEGRAAIKRAQGG